MARTEAVLPGGPRVTDHISLGVLTAQFPLGLVEQVLFETERLSECQRDLPAHVMVYCAIALALYADVSTREVLRCVLEGVRWLGNPVAATAPASTSGISQARTRLEATPLEALYRAVVAPVATAETPWRIVASWASICGGRPPLPGPRCSGGRRPANASRCWNATPRDRTGVSCGGTRIAGTRTGHRSPCASWPTRCPAWPTRRPRIAW